jgi:hypothetical protein
VTNNASLSTIGEISDSHLSYVQGAYDAPLIGTTIGQLFDRIARRDTPTVKRWSFRIRMSGGRTRN